jgi:hypothetical protein
VSGARAARLPWELAEGEVQPWHRDRLAVIYVRQSTAAQVQDHAESTRLQYGLAGRAVALGWAPSRVLVIDEDLGHSASGADARPGFTRLVAEVGLDHVGIVLGIETSRLARSGREWHQLLELCALSEAPLGEFGTPTMLSRATSAEGCNESPVPLRLSKFPQLSIDGSGGFRVVRTRFVHWVPEYFRVLQIA